LIKVGEPPAVEGDGGWVGKGGGSDGDGGGERVRRTPILPSPYPCYLLGHVKLNKKGSNNVLYCFYFY
jgi:hypothetical protein